MTAAEEAEQRADDAKCDAVRAAAATADARAELATRPQATSPASGCIRPSSGHIWPTC